LTLDDWHQSVKGSKAGSELAKSFSGSFKTGIQIIDIDVVLADQTVEVINLIGKIWNSLVVVNNVLGLLVSEFIKELVDEVNNIIELNLVNFFSWSSKFTKNSDDGCNQRRSRLGKVLLEEGNNVGEFSLSLDEASLSAGKRVEEQDRLLAGSNSVSEFLNSLIVSVFFGNLTWLGSSQTNLVSSKTCFFSAEGSFVVLLLSFQIWLFVGLIFNIVVGLIELWSKLVNKVLVWNLKSSLFVLDCS